MIFSRRKQGAGAIEGTQGKYVKRETPPSVPSLTATNVSRTRRSPVAASSLLFSTVPPPPSTTPPPPLLSTSVVAFSTDLTPTDNNNIQDMDQCLEEQVGEEEEEVEEEEEEEEEIDEYNVTDVHFQDVSKELHFDRLPSRSTASENDVYIESNDEPSTSFGVRNNNVLSSRSFNRGALKYVPKKSLTASYSIGNVEQGLRDLSIRESGLASPVQPRFQSLQTLPSEHVMTIQQYRSSYGDLDGSEELPLPENWAIEYTPENQRYYVDHTNRRTHWVHPLVHESLRAGWKKIYDPTNGIYYYNESQKTMQYEHPGIANPIFRTESVNVASKSTMDLNLHIIEEKELPPWLLMYAQSDSSLDHLLEWDLFNIDQLSEYDHLLLKLYKQEVIDIVKKYERMRNTLNREIHRRDVSRPPPPRSHIDN